jgi:hypothetical protein
MGRFPTGRVLAFGALLFLLAHPTKAPEIRMDLEGQVRRYPHTRRTGQHPERTREPERRPPGCCVDVIPNKTVQRSEQLGLIPELASLRESRRSEP